jgi:lipid-binding SYLF domain-containing protein
MKRILMVAFAALAVAVPQLAEAANPQQAVNDAATAAQSLSTGSGIAANARDLLRRARGVMIIPTLVKGGFFFGGQGGTGVLLSRDPRTGSWSYPAFYAMGAGSFGLQIGLEVSRIMLIIMNEKALNAVMQSEFKIGGEAGIAVVTLGGGAEASTTAAGGADIYALAESQGLFGGVAIQGGIVKPEVGNDHAYYGPNVTAQDIVLRRTARNPGAETLRTVLRQAAGAQG